MTELQGWARAWAEAKDRLVAKGLLRPGAGLLSVRRAGDGALLAGGAEDEQPKPADPGLHRPVYAARADVGAVVDLSGPFSLLLPEFGGRMPQVFDEQARHLGPMPAACDQTLLARGLANGGQAVVVGDRVLCLAPTLGRLVLNAELFEKCATAYVLALAAGGAVRPLPGWVRWIANSRLAKDRARAAAAFARGEAPAESRGY
jgi:ribulose-5-phosphate 4-epimerase/fuculose-1-phosphate aldolase